MVISDTLGRVRTGEVETMEVDRFGRDRRDRVGNRGCRAAAAAPAVERVRHQRDPDPTARALRFLVRNARVTSGGRRLTLGESQILRRRRMVEESPPGCERLR